MIIYSTEVEKTLKANNISFNKEYMVIDSSKRNNERIEKFDVLVVYPTKFDLTHPWHPDLDNFLEEIWNYEIDGQVYSRLYKIKI